MSDEDLEAFREDLKRQVREAEAERAREKADAARPPPPAGRRRGPALPSLLIPGPGWGDNAAGGNGGKPGGGGRSGI